ncbi:Conserved oligomeric Golgi complex subunit 8 [Porphyridium purpureum]|uniref:Conserved oligomeric Golgi complex subunit 8 n=1 Tax=Porphyridium purpureum TaxID=35688 RepID=A0A5J4YH47_PORPP|nr:Conserved oligomeric Golgi complex subunit 8 [Porphyridium purpureum]|eukprot:POR8527..scf270_19
MEDAELAGAELRALVAAPLLGTSSEDDARVRRYLDELCGAGTERIMREPHVVAAEVDRLQGVLEDVACANYRALIESFDAAGAVRDGFSRLRGALQDSLQLLPELSEHVRTFSTSAWAQNEKRRVKASALHEYAHVLELLELPSLMLALTQSEHFDEALEVAAYVNKLRLLVRNEPLVQLVHLEVQAVVRRMVHQLLAFLKQPVQLPACLRLVGFLRRLGCMSEMRLRRTFLHCRGEWMRKSLALSANPATAAAQARIVHLSDDTRAMVFEIITQYRAVFGDDEDDGDGSGTGDSSRDTLSAGRRRDDSEAAGNGLSLRSGSNTAMAMSKSARKSYTGILCDWALKVVGEYLHALEPLLFDVLDGANLATALQQSMYCGQSLSRVGCDFRPLLVPIFANAITSLFKRHLQAALDRFGALLDEYRWTAAAVNTSGNSSSGSTAAGGEDATRPETRAGSEVGEEAGAQAASLLPPTELLQFLPLAVLLNGLIGALNEVRQCCQETLVVVLRDQLRVTLIQGAEAMRNAYEAAMRASLRDGDGSGDPRSTKLASTGSWHANSVDKRHFLAMLRAYEVLLVPHIARAFEHCVAVKHSFPHEPIRASLQKMATMHA